MNDTEYLIRTYLMLIPLVLVWLVGLGLAVVNWKRAPLPVLLAVVGIIIGLGTDLLSPAVSLFMARNHHYSGSNDLLPIVVNLFFRVCLTVTWALLISAVFVAVRRIPRRA